MAEQTTVWQQAATTLTGADGGVFKIVEVIPEQVDGAPVVLLHGMFTDRRFWLSDKRIGLAAFLAERGHPVIIAQRRGLSDSPAITARCGLEEALRYDLPILQTHVSARFNQAAFWLGHSFGGVMAARAAAETLDRTQIAGLILLASQFEIGKRALDWPGNLLTRGLVRLYGYLPARTVGLGPVNEPAAAAYDACHWVSQGRRDTAIRSALGAVDVPILAVSGAADRVDPTEGCRRLVSHCASQDLQFVTAGRAQGFAQDYDHPGIVISKEAQREIWPLIGDWLAGHAG